MMLDDRAYLGDDGGHEFATRFEVTAFGVKDSLQLFRQECDITTFAENGRHQAGERYDPLEVVHVF